MRAGELLGRPVYDAGGRRIGRVTDLRCVKETGAGDAWGVLRLDALVVNQRQIGARLGYDRHQRRPALLRGVLRRLHGAATVVPWSNVASWSADGVRLH
jgi:sporulation protein YlmC with PRC-barrel domain